MPQEREKKQRKIKDDDMLLLLFPPPGFVTLRSLLSGPVIDSMTEPDGRLVKSPVEDFSTEDGARQDDEESDGLGRG
jgi:hypothetical protein